jgi:hypothetical protein
MRWRAFDKGLIRGHCTSSTEAILSALARRHQVTNAQSADRDPLLIASVCHRRLTSSLNLTALSFGPRLFGIRFPILHSRCPYQKCYRFVAYLLNPMMEH